MYPDVLSCVWRTKDYCFSKTSADSKGMPMSIAQKIDADLHARF